MFGYIMPFKAELKVREWNLYRSYYCGLCKELKREYGLFARFLLNYDMVLLAMTADDLACAQPPVCGERCIAGPFTKRPVCGSSAGLRLAADSLILTSYYKIVDDVNDEHFAKKLRARFLLLFFKGMKKKAAARMPQADKLFAEQTLAQQSLERRNSTSLDEASDPTAQMTGELFSYCGAQTEILRRLGMFIGKILYYLDAAEDYEKDFQSGAYNVFLQNHLSKDETVEQTQMLCRMCAGEVALCYNLLNLSVYKPILDNILFLGLPQSIAFAGKKRPHHDRHDSL
ncbi:DUF5685 family protein [uncultured Ruthenibacterium sp.]|mgnify:CR=1 FL=1|uniref:DUF5685 family protein n=1 Tax=uncultured Ruthenibacterium sp. TaxID=1905347 RepID=UPI00349E8F88